MPIHLDPVSAATLMRYPPPVGWRPQLVHALLIGALFGCTVGHADEAPADDTTGRLTRLEQFTQATAAERERLAADLAAVQARLTAIEQQTAGTTGDAPAADAAPPTAAQPAPAAGAGSSDQDATPDTLKATEQRLNLLIEQFAIAQQLRQETTTQLAEARTQIAELGARQTQAQLESQDAMLRADKAEKRYAALEEAQERLVKEREQLNGELAATQSRLAESLKQTVALDARLAAAEARVAELTGAATARPAPSVPAAAAPSAAPGASALPASPAVAASPAAGSPAPAVYVVRVGDTLSKISAKVYGDPGAWPRIFDANRAALDTPDQLALGMSLIIP